jgi:hypothetical protein
MEGKIVLFYGTLHVVESENNEKHQLKRGWLRSRHLKSRQFVGFWWGAISNIGRQTA